MLKVWEHASYLNKETVGLDLTFLIRVNLASPSSVCSWLYDKYKWVTESKPAAEGPWDVERLSEISSIFGSFVRFLCERSRWTQLLPAIPISYCFLSIEAFLGSFNFKFLKNLIKFKIFRVACREQSVWRFTLGQNAASFEPVSQNLNFFLEHLFYPRQTPDWVSFQFDICISLFPKILARAVLFLALRFAAREIEKKQPHMEQKPTCRWQCSQRKCSNKWMFTRRMPTNISLIFFHRNVTPRTCEYKF